MSFKYVQEIFASIQENTLFTSKNRVCTILIFNKNVTTILQHRTVNSGSSEIVLHCVSSVKVRALGRPIFDQ